MNWFLLNPVNSHTICVVTKNDTKHSLKHLYYIITTHY